MRITQGAFSFLPDLTDDEIRAAARVLPRPQAGRSRSSTPTTRTRATPTGTCGATRCSTCTTPPASWPSSPSAEQAHRSDYIRVNAFDSTFGVESIALSFIVNRPAEEPGFRLERDGGRRVARSATRLVSYAVDRAPQGERYDA